MPRFYRIVERSGMEGETVLPRRFATLDKAEKAVRRHYTTAEREGLPVLIALELPNGSLTYEY